MKTLQYVTGGNGIDVLNCYLKREKVTAGYLIVFRIRGVFLILTSSVRVLRTNLCLILHMYIYIYVYTVSPKLKHNDCISKALGVQIGRLVIPLLIYTYIYEYM